MVGKCADSLLLHHIVNLYHVVGSSTNNRCVRGVRHKLKKKDFFNFEFTTGSVFTYINGHFYYLNWKNVSSVLRYNGSRFWLFLEWLPNHYLQVIGPWGLKKFKHDTKSRIFYLTKKVCTSSCPSWDQARQFTQPLCSFKVVSRPNRAMADEVTW